MSRVNKSEKGPLVRVEISPGRLVKMYKADAIAAGLLPRPHPSPLPGGEGTRGGEEKRRVVAENKLLLPVDDKGAADYAVDEVDSVGGDDFTAIPGIGPGTAEALQATGLRTFDDLSKADLSRLRANVRKAIEAWREG